MPRIDIPRKSIYRLSIYQRCLQRLKANRVDTVSSEALAKAAGVKSTQLRKDLTYFGQFGTRGLGYNVDSLSTTIGEVLGHNRLQPVVLVGVGNLGSALLRYGFSFRKSDVTESLVHDSIAAVSDRVIAEARSSGNPLVAVIQGVDDTWEISLLRFTIEMIQKSQRINLFDFKRRGLL